MMVSRNYFRTAFINEANLQALELPYSVIHFKKMGIFTPFLFPNKTP
jgi:hypothetical protein